MTSAAESGAADESSHPRHLRALVVAFRDARDWRQFHRPKDLALALGIEAAEIGELMLWRGDEDVAERLAEPDYRRQLGEEMADVLAYLLLLSDATGIDLAEALSAKMAVNARRYPAGVGQGQCQEVHRAGRRLTSKMAGRNRGTAMDPLLIEDELIVTEVLVLGCGVAGATAALWLADQGVHVVVATRAREPNHTNTLWAQGGIVYRGADDTPAALAADVLRAGAGHCNPVAVDILAEEGPAAFESVLLERVRTPFDRTPDGLLSLVREGGHAVARIAHVADHTGQAIQVSLMQALVTHPNITVLVGHTAVDLLTPSHHSRNRLAVYEPRSCVGAYLLNRSNGFVRRCLAGATILATGGLGQIYLHSTNPPGARGDGVAMAQRAGARVINLEFVQFHPTTFHHETAPSLLISEAVRGAGARLVRADGEPFMQQYEPEWKDLAPRDVVARAIRHEMLAHELPHVYLDLRSYLPRDRIVAEFPTIRESLLPYGVDMATDLVPVVPAAHYACGGVWVDTWGGTTVAQLYAIGEVSCTGVHGANRLASTSLLEGLVWGTRAARRIVENRERSPDR